MSAAVKKAPPRSSLSQMIEDSLKFPILSRAEEHDLAVRARAGDRGARARLISSNVRLVIQVTRSYARRTEHDADDVVMAGMAGLCMAADRFDPESGNKFGTYAVWWIRATASKHARETAHLVVMKRTTVRGTMTSSCPAQVLSLDAPVMSEEGVTGMTFVDTLEDVRPTAEDLLTQDSDEAKLRRALAKVARTAPERKVVAERILSREPKTLKTIGDEMGVSRERVRQLEKRLIEAAKLVLMGGGITIRRGHGGKRKAKAEGY